MFVIGRALLDEPLEVFCKKRCSQKFRKIHMKTPLSESLFNVFCNPEACNFIRKETPTQVFFWEFGEAFSNTFSIKHLRYCTWCNLTHLVPIYLPLHFSVFWFSVEKTFDSTAECEKKRRLAQWLATCARKLKIPGTSPAASYVRRWLLLINRQANVSVSVKREKVVGRS